ncbi:MAG: glycosyltransferase [Gammaproteobacteria bacterium]|nr:glycosyltransferase [Gammaproteobacteria bacterium]
MKVLVVEGPLLPSQMAHWDRMHHHGVDLHLAGTLRSPKQNWWVPQKPENVAVSLFSPRGWVARGSLWWVYPGLTRLIRELKPDVIHVASEPWALFYSQVGLDDHRVVGHGADNLWVHGSWIENGIRLRRARRILGKLSGFTSWNQDGVRLAHRHGLPAGTPTLVAPSRLPSPEPFRRAALERERLRNEFGMKDEVAVGYVGRLMPAKGLDWLFHSFSAAGLPNARLHIFGSGPQEASLRALASELHLPVVFQGPVPPDRIPAVMAGLDLLAVPSLTTPGWTEQFGRVVIEAMLAGTPVIASDSGSLPEVVGKGGIVVRELDVASLAEALTCLVEDPGERREKGEAARNWVEERFTPDVLAGMFARFWTAVASR